MDLNLQKGGGTISPRSGGMAGKRLQPAAKGEVLIAISPGKVLSAISFGKLLNQGVVDKRL